MKDKKAELVTLLVVLVPFIGVGLLLWRFGITPFNLYLPASEWNDELSYYKQLEAIVHYGYPRGYYGYNESQALIGTFGPWSIAHFLPYSFLFKIFGISYNRVFIINILLWMITLYVTIKELKCDNRAKFLIVILWVSFANISRYTLSITPEAVVMMLFILLVVFTLRIEMEANSRVNFVASQIIFLLLVLMRGYYAAYVLTFIWVYRKHTKKVIVTAFSTVIGIVGYLLSVKYFTCPYFFDLVNIDWLKAIKNNPIEGINLTSQKLWQGLLCSVEYINGITDVETDPIVGVMYFLAFIIIASLLVLIIVNKDKLALLYLLSFLAILSSMWLLYDVYTGCRHLIASIAGLSIFFVVRYKGIIVRLMLITLFAILTWGFESEYDLKPPVRDEQLMKFIENSYVSLCSEIPVSESYWDNTVIWTLSTDFRTLYALPDFVGISICYDGYVIEQADELKAKYCAVNESAEEVMALARTKDWVEVERIDSTIIYRVR